MCTLMFTAALFTIAKIWKQPKCPSMDEWIKKRKCYDFIYIILHTYVFHFIERDI